ncbi:MAG: sigma-70 family RNA polymerase sigma factor [Planctomycetaceae bacterium]
MDEGVRTPNNLVELVEQYSALLYRYAYRLTGSTAEAEDLTQQTFLSAHAKFSQLRNPEHAKSWLCTILRNAYLKSRRSASGRPFLLGDQHRELAAETIPEGPFDSEEVQQALDELPDDFKIPLVMFYFQDMSYREIAEELEIPVGTVMSRLARAKSSVRITLEQRLVQYTGEKSPRGT